MNEVYDSSYIQSFLGVGPGTLVGSAACDLFLIHAMCIIIPKRGAIKKVADRNVWAVELVWSLWAYVWLYIILLVSVSLSLHI